MDKKILIGALGALAFFSFCLPAQADDEKTQASSICQGTFPSDRDRAYYYTSELRAVGGEVQLNCSLIRDIEDHRMLWVDVRYEKQSGHTITGRVYSCNAAFHECSWKAATSSSGEGQHSVFIDSSDLPYSDTYGRYFSYWSRLPEGDWLLNLTSREDS